MSGPAAELGNTWVVIGVALVAAVLAVTVLRRWRLALMFAVALVGELAIFLTTTAVIDRPRPPVAHLDAELPPTVAGCHQRPRPTAVRSGILAHLV